jgi:hypothetical protein
MQKVHCIVMTRNDDLIIEHWIKKHINVFDTISVVDGSDGDFTEQLCKQYNILYTKDPTDKPFHEQYLREAAFTNLKPYIQVGDWVGCFMADEWVYHDPRKIVEGVEPWADVVSWNQLNVLPHPSEKEEYFNSVKEGRYNPTEAFKHYWFRDNTKTCFEPRMFKYTGNEFWTHNIPSENPVAGRIEPVSHNAKSGVIPTYFHYKVFDLDPAKYKNDGFAHFEKSNLNTGIGYGKGQSTRTVETIDDLFFDEDNIYCNMGTADDGTDYVHGYCARIGDDGLIPEQTNYNRLGNSEDVRLIL